MAPMNGLIKRRMFDTSDCRDNETTRGPIDCHASPSLSHLTIYCILLQLELQRENCSKSTLGASVTERVSAYLVEDVGLTGV